MEYGIWVGKWDKDNEEIDNSVISAVVSLWLQFATKAIVSLRVSRRDRENRELAWQISN